jgi:hypothetical protein
MVSRLPLTTPALGEASAAAARFFVEGDYA